jgi:hypothetical protein
VEQSGLAIAPPRPSAATKRHGSIQRRFVAKAVSKENSENVATAPTSVQRRPRIGKRAEGERLQHRAEQAYGENPAGGLDRDGEDDDIAGAAKRIACVSKPSIRTIIKHTPTMRIRYPSGIRSMTDAMVVCPWSTMSRSFTQAHPLEAHGRLQVREHHLDLLTLIATLFEQRCPSRLTSVVARHLPKATFS